MSDEKNQKDNSNNSVSNEKPSDKKELPPGQNKQLPEGKNAAEKDKKRIKVLRSDSLIRFRQKQEEKSDKEEKQSKQNNQQNNQDNKSSQDKGQERNHEQQKSEKDNQNSQNAQQNQKKGQGNSQNAEQNNQQGQNNQQNNQDNKSSQDKGQDGNHEQQKSEKDNQNSKNAQPNQKKAQGNSQNAEQNNQQEPDKQNTQQNNQQGQDNQQNAEQNNQQEPDKQNTQKSNQQGQDTQQSEGSKQQNSKQQKSKDESGEQKLTEDEEQDQEEVSDFMPLSSSEFKKKIKEALGECFDIVIDKFKTQHDEAVVVYIDGLTDKNLVDRDVIRPLKSKDFDGNIEENINAAFNAVYKLDEVVSKVLDGNAIVYYANDRNALTIDFKSWDKRSVDTPEAEGVIRGPKEGYTENLLTNLSLLRRKLKTPNLVVENMVLGRQSNTKIAVIYLKDIVNRSVLKELRKRLKTIDVDSILETGQIEQLIEKKPFSIISGMGLTQKPDVTAARILEGRVAVMCDGTPHVLTIPELFVETLHKSEDYYTRTLYTNFIRILRLLAIIISTLLPGFALAILTYSQEMVPFVFLTTFIQATEGTPLPEMAELLFLSISFDLLKEAGLRMPKSVGSAITIVGALILGDVAVSAGIVGAPSVIIIAITAVASLIVVDLNEFTTIYRYVFLVLGGIMGVIGISAGIILVLTQLVSTKTFGIPILSTFGKNEIKDSFIRYPLKSLRYRPKSIVKNNKRRYGDME